MYQITMSHWSRCNKSLPSYPRIPELDQNIRFRTKWGSPDKGKRAPADRRALAGQHSHITFSIAKGRRTVLEPKHWIPGDHYTIKTLTTEHSIAVPQKWNTVNPSRTSEQKPTRSQRVILGSSCEVTAHTRSGTQNCTGVSSSCSAQGWGGWTLDL